MCAVCAVIVIASFVIASCILGIDRVLGSDPFLQLVGGGRWGKLPYCVVCVVCVVCCVVCCVACCGGMSVWRSSLSWSV